jgi:transmembrane sensor
MSDLARWTQLLERFRAGSCSPEEIQELRELAVVDPARAQILGSVLPWRGGGSPARGRTAATVEQDLAAVLDASRRRPGGASSTDDARSNALFARVVHYRRRDNRSAGTSARRPVKPIRASIPLIPLQARYAALIVAVVAVGALVSHHFLTRQNHIGQSQAAEYTTARGEQRSITLPDGSHVELAPETRLTFRREGVARHLELVGEAAFDVAHDAHRPFAVRAAGALTTDVGTRFVLRAYGSDSDVRVLVTDGVVALQSIAGGKSYRVSSGSLGVVGERGNTRVQPADPTDPLVLWSSRQLGFRRTPLRLAILDVGRWYNLDVRLADSSLANRLVSGTLPPTSADEAISTLANVVGAHWERRGSVVTLSAVVHRGCVRPARHDVTGHCSVTEDSSADR